MMRGTLSRRSATKICDQLCELSQADRSKIESESGLEDRPPGNHQRAACVVCRCNRPTRRVNVVRNVPTSAATLSINRSDDWGFQTLACLNQLFPLPVDGALLFLFFSGHVHQRASGSRIWRRFRKRYQLFGMRRSLVPAKRPKRRRSIGSWFVWYQQARL